MTKPSGTPWLAPLAIGLGGGVASGLLGIGGGLVMVPLLTLLLHVPFKRAVGTSLVGVIGISIVAVAAEVVVAPANLKWAAAALLAAGSLAGARLGAAIVRRTHATRLAQLFAVLLLVAAWKLADPLALLDRDVEPAGLALASQPLVAALLVLTGVIAGIVAAMFGVGGGVVVVPMLALLHPEWTFHACRATSLVMIVPTAALGAFLHHGLDQVDAGLARPLVRGGAVGAVAGVMLANQLPERPLELVFAALLVIAAARLLRHRPPAAE